MYVDKVTQEMNEKEILICKRYHIGTNLMNYGTDMISVGLLLSCHMLDPTHSLLSDC